MNHASENTKINIAIEDGPTLSLPEDVQVSLSSIATRNSVSYESAIAIALVNQDFLDGLIEEGAEIIIKRGRKLNRLDYI